MTYEQYLRKQNIKRLRFIDELHERYGNNPHRTPLTLPQNDSLVFYVLNKFKNK